MKKLVYISLLTSLIAVSCSKDFLNEKNPNALSSETFWKTAADADRGLVGCYSALQNAQLYNGNGDGTVAEVFRLEILTDNAHANTRFNYIHGTAVARGTHNTDDAYVASLWTGCYRLIARCNDFLANIDRVTAVTEPNRNTMKVEVRFLRALGYQILAMTYRDVPLILTTQTLADSRVPKNTNQEINAFIENELNAISSGANLPLVAPVLGKVTRGAALALLARQYLYTAKFIESAAAAKKVMDLNQYILNSNYRSLFTVVGESSKEIIFQVTYAGPGLGAGVGAAYAGYYNPEPPVFLALLPNLVNDYYFTDGKPKGSSALYNPANELTNRDPRFDATIVSINGSFRNVALTAARLAPTGYRYRKFTEEVQSVSLFDTGQDFYVMRYAEVLLTRAEALLESGVYTEAEVTGLINLVRSRVGMPSVAVAEGINLTQAQLRQIVRRERRVETAFEGLRFFDLKRWGIYEDRAVTVYNNIDRVIAPGLEARLAIGAKHALFPIPQGEIDANNALVQHPEWK